MLKLFNYFLLLVIVLFTACQGENQIDNSHRLDNFKTADFLFATSDIPLISTTTQIIQANDYLKHYFSPWTGQQAYMDADRAKILAYEKMLLIKNRLHPGFAANQQKITIEFLDALSNNMDLAHSQNHEQLAITIANADLRVFPTAWPCFEDPEKPGKAYPFDEWQASYLNNNTPVHIWQQTHDSEYSLITTHNGIGWIKTNALAIVDQHFIHQWQRAKLLVLTTPTLLTNAQGFYEMARIGTLLPLKQETSQNYQVYFAVADEDRHAKLKLTNVNLSHAQIFPVPLTEKNISAVADQFVGQNYAWGGMYGGYDCSLTLMYLFAPFGIWLPNSSNLQLQTGKTFALPQSSLADKEKFIQQNAKPFVTLLGVPGHVMLYLGARQHQLYIFNTIWGLRTHPWFSGEGRWIIGKTVVMPLDYGADQKNTTTLLQKITTMVVLI